MQLRRKCVKLRKYINYVVTNLMYAALYLNCTLSYCTCTVPVLAANSWLKIDGAEDGDDQLGPSRVVPSLHLVMMKTRMRQRKRFLTGYLSLTTGERETKSRPTKKLKASTNTSSLVPRNGKDPDLGSVLPRRRKINPPEREEILRISHLNLS